MNTSIDPTPSEDRTPWATLFPIGAVTPLACVHQGIDYPGEVVRAGRWSSELGRPPGNGSHFKIVLLQERPRNGLPHKVDAMTAVCLPASGSSRQAHRIIGEITAAKQAAYLTRRDQDAAAINSALRERQHDLESRLVSEESARLSKGVIHVEGRPGPDPSEIYSGGNPLHWIESLAGWLLARAYPSLPIDAQSLPHRMAGDDAGRLFASIFSQSGADPELLGRFGPALGLSFQGSAGSYDPCNCRVFSLIREKINGGLTDFAEIHRFLAYDIGLTGRLASLFLLLFIRHERPEHQIQLHDGSTMFLADGGPLLGARLTPDLIPLLAWDDQLNSKAACISPATTPRFIDAKHHLAVLCPELASSESDVADETLARFTESFHLDIATASRILDSLDVRWDAGARGPAETSKLRASLERLGRISRNGYADVYHSIRAGYSTLAELTQDLETLRQLVLLDNHSGEISKAHSYIVDATVPPSKFPNLSVDRDTLLTGLSPSRLIRSRGRGWSAVARDVEGFKIRYTQAYREHHRQFHDELPGYQAALIESKRKLAALKLLSTIHELGPPAGAGLEESLAALPQGPSPCPFGGDELDLSLQPGCPECRITLDQAVPTGQLARLAPQIDTALGAKTQHLSKLLVEKALAGKADGRWREFLQIVRVSDLSSLANTLDPDLVSFIRQVLD